MAKITPEELVQDVREFIQEDLNFDPPQSRHFYTTNIFQRTLAHIVGWTPWGARMLRCTTAGELKTAPTTTGIENYKLYRGDGTDTWLVFTWEGNVAARMDIFVWGNPLKIELSVDGITYLQEIEVDPGFYSIDVRTRGGRFVNWTIGQNARYQIIGWW